MEGGRIDPEDGGHIPDGPALGAKLAAEVDVEGELGPPELLATTTSGGEAGAGPLPDQLALQLGNGGDDGDDLPAGVEVSMPSFMDTKSMPP